MARSHQGLQWAQSLGLILGKPLGLGQEGDMETERLTAFRSDRVPPNPANYHLKTVGFGHWRKCDSAWPVQETNLLTQLFAMRFDLKVSFAPSQSVTPLSSLGSHFVSWLPLPCFDLHPFTSFWVPKRKQ